jgi:ABC-type multidrug transport system ATPase subunit
LTKTDLSMSEPPILQIDNLYKTYGSITALDHLDLSIQRGAVFGLLGPNGSGKTTTLGLVLDVLKPTSGSFRWFGKGGGHEQRKHIGAILEKPNFYTKLSARKNLELVCRIKGVPQSRIGEVLNQVGLGERQDYDFQTFSLGMKQRLAIASALLADPDVLILDEPTNGLDPEGIAEIRQLILEIAHTGKTIILASHLLDEVQKVCSEFAILKQGKLIHSGRVDAGFGDEEKVEIASEALPQLAEALSTFEGYLGHIMQKDFIEAKFTKGTSIPGLSRYLSDKGIYLTHLRVSKKNLEQQFMEILAEHR